MVTTKQKKGVIAVFRKWAEALEIVDELSVEFVNRADAIGDFLVAASVESTFPYATSHINIYPVVFEMTEPELAKTAIHELLHVALRPITALIRDLQEGRLVTAKEASYAEERFCDTLARSIHGLAAPGSKSKRKEK